MDEWQKLKDAAAKSMIRLDLLACLATLGDLPSTSMSDGPEDWEYFQDLYRFAYILTLKAEIAGRVVVETLASQPKLPPGSHDIELLMSQLIREVHRRALAAVPAPSRQKLPPEDLPADAERALISRKPKEIQAALHRIGEPERTALTLLYLDVMAVEEIQKLLKLELSDLSDLLQSARCELYAAVEEVIK